VCAYVCYVCVYVEHYNSSSWRDGSSNAVHTHYIHTYIHTCIDTYIHMYAHAGMDCLQLAVEHYNNSSWRDGSSKSVRTAAEVFYSLGVCALQVCTWRVYACVCACVYIDTYIDFDMMYIYTYTHTCTGWSQ
jgi:hypothetical protein